MSAVIQSSPAPVISQRPKFGHLPALPEVTIRILSLAKDPDSSTTELHRLISSDIALSTRILKVVNSVFYGLPRQIGTIERAVSILGRVAVRNIAIAASMVRIFHVGQRENAAGVDPRNLWLHSTATATAARIAAGTLRIGDGNEIFLAALMHDIGIMAEMHWATDKLARCIRDAKLDADGVPAEDLRVAETRWFGLDHQQLGREVCDNWNFPLLITSVVGSHHSPFEVAEDYRATACIVHLADVLAASLPNGFRTDLPSIEIAEDVLDNLRLRRSALPAISDRLTLELDEVAQMLS